ncbi:MAG: hypothetical protein Q4C87_05525 [Actinomycetaceae bacterium]|nr:hypothetical protein [Actinomycetaceae bacterium]
MTLQRNAPIARLIHARLLGGAPWITIATLTYIAGVTTFAIIPSYVSASALGAGLIPFFILFFGILSSTGNYLQQGIHPAHLASGASRKELALSGWALTLINIAIGVTLWVLTHVLLEALPWQIKFDSSNSITHLSVVTLFLVNIGIFARLALPYWAKGTTIHNVPYVFPLAIPAYIPMLLLFGMNSIDPAILPWLVLFDIPVTIGLAWWLWRTESRFTYAT